MRNIEVIIVYSAEAADLTHRLLAERKVAYQVLPSPNEAAGYVRLEIPRWPGTLLAVNEVRDTLRRNKYPVIVGIRFEDIPPSGVGQEEL